MRPLTQAERDAFARWHYAAGDYGPDLADHEREDANILANLASELFLADHFERITEERLREIGFIEDGCSLRLVRHGDTIDCHSDLSDWWINGESLNRRLEPRFMGELQDIMYKLWGPQ